MMAWAARRRAIGLLVAGALLAGVLAGCAEDLGDEGEATLEIIDLDRELAAGVAEVEPARVNVLPAADLRLLLERLLGWHGALTVDVMRAAANDDPDLSWAIDALQENTAALTGAVGVVYGRTGAAAFDQLWTAHTQFFLDYARARGDGDDEAAQAARDDLGDYQRDFASFFATATGGTAPIEVVEGLLDTHVTQLLDQLDAFVDGDPAAATDLAHDAHEYLFTVAQALTGAIAAQDPVAFAGVTTDPITEFCSLLGRTLGETAIGTSVATRAIVADDPLAIEAVEALDASTDRLVGALDQGGLGSDGWSELTDAITGLARSLRDGRDAEIASALTAVEDAGAAIAARLPNGAAATLGTYVDQLTASLRATADNRSADAVAAELGAYDAGYDLAGTLAGRP